MQQRALAGQATAVVQMGCELADELRQAGRRAIDLLLDQAAPAQPTGGACACGGPTHSEGFEPKSFVMRFGRVSVMRRRCGCDAWASSELAFDKALSLPDGELADDVREATSILTSSIEAQSCCKTMALRSATECAAIIDASTALGVADGPTGALGRQHRSATVRMLSRMVQNLKTSAPRKTRRSQSG